MPEGDVSHNLSAQMQKYKKKQNKTALKPQIWAFQSKG